jgi:2-polyprenyl-3-methyl-5-hydroxy-6-metoxy-1,4-benzoquinol methylase
MEQVHEERLGGTALDFGAGRGELASRLAACGRFERVVAADLVAYGTPPEGVEWLNSDLNDPLPLADGSIDVVLAVEVVEHLENIRAVCREWARLLRPGGAVLLTTPNNESVRSVLSLVFRGHFVAFLDASYPAHITALVRKDLERALSEAGLAPQGFFFTDDGAVPRLTRFSWQQISAGRLRGLRFSDNLGCVARKPAQRSTEG